MEVYVLRRKQFFDGTFGKYEDIIAFSKDVEMECFGPGGRW
jgi:hypothetical protein